MVVLAVVARVVAAFVDRVWAKARAFLQRSDQYGAGLYCPRFYFLKLIGSAPQGRSFISFLSAQLFIILVCVSVGAG